MTVRQSFLSNGLKITVLIIVLLQVVRADWTEVFKVDGLENYYFYQRLNQYPPRFARLGFYVEKYLESTVWVSMRAKVFDAVDFRKIADD
jgi:hypothetical protein